MNQRAFCIQCKIIDSIETVLDIFIEALLQNTLVETTERLRQLANVPFFSGLTPKGLELFAKVAAEETHALGTTLFSHGDSGDKLYILLEGQIRISRTVSGLGEEALAILGPGSVFGEMALVDDGYRSADARVHSPCKLLSISKESFNDLLFLNKELAYEVLWSMVRLLSQRLRESNDKLTFLSSSGKFY